MHQQLIVSRRNIRHNIHVHGRDLLPVLFLRAEGGGRAGSSAILPAPGRVRYQDPATWRSGSGAPVVIESDAPIELDAGPEALAEHGAGILKRIYIHQANLLRNRKGGRFPPISVPTSRGVVACFEARVLGASWVVYSNCKPQPCGARVWLETRFPVEADAALVA
jgi:hypothetical protein